LEDLLGMFMLAMFPGCLLWIWFPIVWIVWKFIEAPFAVGSWILLLALLVGVLAPVKYWKAGMESWAAELIIRYFSFKVVWEEPLEPENNAYILVAPPHGVFPFGNILTILFLHNYANFHFRGAGASVLYHIPIMRHVMRWLGCIDADFQTMKKTLSDGHSVGLSTGGIAELFETSPVSETIIINDRKGFVRLALATGSPLVPCYLFGNTQALHCLSDKNKFMQNFSRKIKASITFFWGRWGLPIAYRTPIMGVMGKPIFVPKLGAEKPSDELVNKIHKEFVDSIQALFERHKRIYGWEKKKLLIK